MSGILTHEQVDLLMAVEDGLVILNRELIDANPFLFKFVTNESVIYRDVIHAVNCMDVSPDIAELIVAKHMQIVADEMLECSIRYFPDLAPRYQTKENAMAAVRYRGQYLQFVRRDLHCAEMYVAAVLNDPMALKYCRVLWRKLVLIAVAQYPNVVLEFDDDTRKKYQRYVNYAERLNPALTAHLYPSPPPALSDNYYMNLYALLLQETGY